jgi:hypothetical protein
MPPAFLLAFLPVVSLAMAQQTKPIETTTMQPLTDSIEPVQRWFEAHDSTPRFLAILSPRCDLCVAGAHAIRDELLGKHPDADISVGIAWIPMVSGDDHDAAVELSNLFASDARVTQFDDSNRLLGTAVGEQLLHEGGGVAWDMYMFFDEEARWDDGLPQPTHWIHQLSGTKRADPALFRTGDALRTSILELTEVILDSKEGQAAMTPPPAGTIEFLSFDSCPNYVELQANLETALEQMGIASAFTPVDLAALGALDTRRGYGSPTILVNGVDLFGARSRGTSLSCRIYRDGVPDAGALEKLIHERLAEAGLE